MALSVNQARFQANLRRLEAALSQHLTRDRATVQAATKDAAIWAAREMARVTFPNRYGFVLAKAQITHELRQLYGSPSAAYEAVKNAVGVGRADRFYHHFSARNYSAAQRILDDANCAFSGIPCGRLNPALHDPARTGPRGHISVDRPRQIVPKEDLAAYTPKAVKRLGKTASGWSAVAELLGSPQAPGFKSTLIHGRAGGSLQVNRGRLHPGYLLSNLRPLSRRHCSPGQVARVIRQATLLLLGILRRRTGRRSRNT